MAQAGSQNASLSSHTYTPPRLPDCLSDVHSLKPIVGVPSNEEVKAIHAAIRGLNGVLAAPALYDPDLPMQLAQHLFEVQMAIYRNTYSFSLIPVEATYTPPELPSHIPIALEPVLGAPSDEDIRLAQTAVRMMGSLATNPYVFDPDLSANLSQYLFNIQAARYIQHSTQGQFVSLKPKERRAGVSNEIEHVSSQDQVADLPETAGSTDSTTEQHPDNQTPATSQSDIIREAQYVRDDINRLIRVMRNINHALVSSQHDSVRLKGAPACFALMNLKGELPSKYDLPLLTSFFKKSPNGGSSYYRMCYNNTTNALSNIHLASYLRFYDIGAGLFQENDSELTIVPDKTDEAAKLLHKHLADNLGSGWAVPS